MTGSRGVDEIIRKAIERGEFDDLPGAGKPLDMEANPHADPEWRLAYKMLRDGGYSLPWIEARQEVEKELAEAREALSLAWAWRGEKLSAGEAADYVEAEWARAMAAFGEKVEAVNQKIADYNLQTPHTRFQRQRVDVEREMRRIKGETD